MTIKRIPIATHHAVARRRMLAAAASVLAITATAFVVAPPSVATEAGEPFTCDGPMDFLAQGTPTQMYATASEAGTPPFVALGTPSTFSYNAIGLDPSDGFIYGIQDNTNVLVRVDSSGSVTSIGPVSGLPDPTGADSYLVGAFDPTGSYWVSDNSATAWKIDVTAPVPAATALPLSRIFGPIDFTYDAGYLWGLGGRTIWRLDISNGQVMPFPATAQIRDDLSAGTIGGSIGADWTYKNGDLGFSDNSSGMVYRISVSSGASPTFADVSHYVGPAASQKDGTACVPLPAAATALTVANTTVVRSLLTLKIHFSATLTKVANATPIPGQTVNFLLGSSTGCSGVTDANGVASCNVSTLSNLLPLLLNSKTHATYTGNSRNAPSTGDGRVTLA